jgi:hypothetical protein
MAKKNEVVIEQPLKIMVASTVYNFQDTLEQICGTLTHYGYEVMNSHLKTVKTNPRLSNLQNCLNAVEESDLVFGIITPRYGAVLDGDVSITHQEMRRAIELEKPRWFVSHRDIFVARELLKQYMYLPGTKPAELNPDFLFSKTGILDDIRLVHQYNDVIRNDVDAAARTGHWVEEYYKGADILQVIKTQFKDVDRIRKIVEDMKPKK